MTEPTPTPIRVMTIAEGIESLNSYYDHIAVMLKEQKEVMNPDQYRAFWVKIEVERKLVQKKLRDLLWQFYSTMQEDKMKSKRDETLIIN